MIPIAGIQSLWAAVVVIVIPAAIIAAAELDERLRQRESSARPVMRTLRTWALPLFAVWALLVPVLGAERDNVLVRLVLSGLVLALAAAGLGLLKLAVQDIKRRSQLDDRRSVPELLLALPRIGVLIATGWILVDSIWGVDLSAALTALGVTSLVVSFALQDTLSGLASGVLLLGDQPFKPGDWISTDDLEGKVIDINWRTTRLRNRDGDMLIVPNAQLANATVTNHSTPEPLTRVVFSVQVAFKNPPTAVKDMLLDAARSTPGVLSDPAPDVLVNQVDDPLMGYDIHMWIDDYAIKPKVKADFGALVWYQSHRHDVPLPSPAQDLYLYDAANTPGDRDFEAADVRRSLMVSPLLASLPDDELDRLSVAARPVRFRAGEEVMDSQSAATSFALLVEGEATLCLSDPGEPTVTITELREGELLGLLGADAVDGHRIVVQAVSDCEILLLPADVALEIGNRNAEVADALRRTSAIRRRRIDRVLRRRDAISTFSREDGLA